MMVISDEIAAKGWIVNLSPEYRVPIPDCVMEQLDLKVGSRLKQWRDGDRICFEAIEDGTTDEEVLRTEGVEISIVEEYKGAELVIEIH